MESLTNADKTMDMLIDARQTGVTVAEVRRKLRIHHGTASGLLSTLHREGIIMRLADKRGDYKVYVLPRYVGKRKTERQGRLHTCPECGHEF